MEQNQVESLTHYKALTFKFLCGSLVADKLLQRSQMVWSQISIKVLDNCTRGVVLFPDLYPPNIII
jgi:hypothetical protein